MTGTRVADAEEGAEDEARRERRRRARIARVVVWSARIVGLLSIISIFAPAARRRLEPAAWFGLPVEATLVGTVVLATAGVGLMLLATGLRRRKRRAWQLAVLLCLVIIASHALGRHPIPPLVVAVILLVGLLWTRREFDALPDPVGRFVAVRVVLQLLVAGFVIVSAMLLFVRPSFLVGRPSAGDRLLHALLSLIGVEGPVEFRFVWYDDLTSAVGLTFGVGALVLGGYFLLRSAEPRPQLSAEEQAGIRGLLEKHGKADSLGYFALRRDKAVVFSETGKAAVAYRVVAGVALASGDPLGDVEAWPGAIEEFVGVCRRHGWVPAVLGCSETGARVWSREAGLDALELGDEAVVDVATFSLQGRAMRTVRQAVSRIKRAGYETTVRRLRDVPAAELTELAACVERWRGGPDERGFSMALSRVGDAEADPEAVVVVATAEGAPRGLLQFVPWGTEGLSLDLMIRDPAVTENGLNELLITDLLAACRGLGVDRVSLNFAVFRSALERGERIGAGPVARLWARLLRIASRWWQIETLYRFNARFGPTWVPRFLVFDAVRDLPRIAVAAFEAEGYGGRPPALLRVLRR
ncbi:phosphatidylglycerol lysyltransferase domain-containing protein [Actinomycetospora soli]|uniref:phosphatidylglycerol lysyltransferase domain-containing protein n=1 Tax=Actinomycetospora soli TaxID=2893887 RepID=UPI001E62DD63|nr:phosphatidylglycerol lysyltransferase domain-containing protein [Actinomycetospora soli]MCD2188421.1 phosphatidylglycerol lysyltransferase domain-containing protein [Actinomycetospora soli]